MHKCFSERKKKNLLKCKLTKIYTLQKMQFILFEVHTIVICKKRFYFSEAIRVCFLRFCVGKKFAWLLWFCLKGVKYTMHIYNSLQ